MVRALSFTSAGAAMHSYDGDIADFVWTQLDELKPFTQLGYKANLNRYSDGSRKMRKDFIHVWWMKSFQIEHTAIESGFMASKKIEKIVAKSSRYVAGAPGDASTSSGKVTPLDKAIKSCCQNAVEIAAAFLGEEWNEAVCKCIVFG